ncbi:lysophosphatidylserine lipase ABHD12-like [Spea bombifrons]|uniref:lysophosphatidylserine lipase ABHD12-like n=1 Tax=Spea bombifrons TaxID=233779 RepID=UPI00234AAD2E|nr:lysophosphatidylserine lipase ABHD12-like [Spea bombifrons]
MKRRDPPQKRGSVTPLPGKGSKSDSKDASATQTSKSRKRSSSPWFSYLKKFALVLFVVYISAPFTIRLFPVLLSKVVYLNMVRVPFFVDTRYPEDVLNHTSNFYLTPEEGITVGVWHTVPASRGEEAKGKDHGWFEAALSDNNPVIIYLHGNGGTRAVDHRVQLIKVLSAAGFHVLSIDYRGFADSTGEPSEEGVTNDSAYLYEWVKARSRGSPVCLWGHSLGTGIATNAARRLQEKGNAPDGVILEAPYTNIREAGAYHPFGKIYHIFPGFEYFFLDTFALSNNVFPNDQNVKIMSSPLLILHAEDDQVVPSAMAKKLHEIALTSPHSRQVKLVLYPAEHGYKHKFIYKDPELPGIIWAFLNAI